MDKGELADGAVFARSVLEPQVFTIIFDRYYRSVYGYLSRRVGRTIADDLAAETFCRAFERRSSYDTTAERALPWLLGIAINLLAHHRRSEVRQLRALAAVREPESERFTDAATGRVDAASARASLAAALEQLDDYDREALLLYAWAELKYEEIAGVLGIPVGTVRSRLHRTRGKLRQTLEQTMDGSVVQLRREGAGNG
jgi:RNA polymerase sigma factor (sigma-70 family)